jgi:hypothetical protein
MTHVTSLIVALKTITLVLGGLITYFSFKAYQRTGGEPLKYLSVGFAVVTFGTLIAGVIDQLLPYSNDIALAVQSALTAVGFAVIVYSLYSE